MEFSEAMEAASAAETADPQGGEAAKEEGEGIEGVGEMPRDGTSKKGERQREVGIRDDRRSRRGWGVTPRDGKSNNGEEQTEG